MKADRIISRTIKTAHAVAVNVSLANLLLVLALVLINSTAGVQT